MVRIVSQTGKPNELEADFLVLGVWEGEEPTPGTPPWLVERVAALKAGRDFTGKPNELLCLYDVEGVRSRRVQLVGLGKLGSASPSSISRAAGSAARSIAGKERGVVLFPLLGEGAGNLSVQQRAESLVTGALIGVQGQDLHRSEKSRTPMKELRIVCAPEQQADVAKGAASGEVVGQAVNFARSLVDLTPAELYPEELARRAVALAAEVGVQATVLDEHALEQLQMGCILGVGKGSTRPPRLLLLRYNGTNDSSSKTLGLVGKGVTFDSGGLSLKTAEGMVDMKCDMAGAASVLAATWAIAKLRLPVRLLTVAPIVENMPSGSAFHPGDVLRARNGKTIEIANTDAEGRLILADALCYAVEQGVDHLVDLATLTGACMVALGTKVAGLMTNAAGWCDEVSRAAERAGERVWQLPMFDEYDELIKSKIADMKNTGGRYGGAITAAKLLAQFVSQVPWVHVDLAGPAYTDKDEVYVDGGGTGYFVRTLVELARGYGATR